MDQPQEFFTVYRFLTAEAGCKTLESGKLRVGRLAELNDPFEFAFGFDPTLADRFHPDDQRRTWIEYVQRMNKKFGILCFSGEWRDPVIWGHYSAKHTGLALRFKIPKKDSIWEVKYSDKRPWYPVDTTEEHDRRVDVLYDLCSTKAASWSYEREVRMLIDLRGCDVAAGSFFSCWAQYSTLEAVLLGCNSQLEELYVRRVIEQKGYKDVEVRQVQMSCSEFLLE